MSKYKELISEIKRLTKEADLVRKEERSAALKSARELIMLHGFSVAELKIPASTRPDRPKTSKVRKTAAKKKGPSRKVAPKYQDGNGNYWTGRGKKPLWVAARLAEGQTLESLQINQS